MLLLRDLGGLARKNIPRQLLFSRKAYRLFTQSRRDDACERLRPLSGLRPLEEKAEDRALVGAASESRASVGAASERLNFS